MTDTAVTSPHDGPAHFTAGVRLSKHEVFRACQALADADRCLVGSGHLTEAGALGVLFELLEGRLVAVDD